MVIYRPKTPMDAVELRKKINNSVFLAGGTENLRLGSSVGSDDSLIDINNLVEKGIQKESGSIIRIGALTTLQELIDSPLVPECVKKACYFCSSFEKRNSATVGGNIGSRRDDSFLLSLFSVLGVTFHSFSPHGEEMKSVSEYANTKCRRLIDYFLLDTSKKAFVKRFGLTATSHASVIAASSSGLYALSVKGSPFIFGSTPSIYEEINYVDDITGSAEYKKYLASIVFTLKEAQLC